MLTVLVNEKAREPLSLIGGVQGANDMAWKMLAADITTQIRFGRGPTEKCSANVV